MTLYGSGNEIRGSGDHMRNNWKDLTKISGFQEKMAVAFETDSDYYIHEIC
jgi:hypothetical protein